VFIVAPVYTQSLPLVCLLLSAELDEHKKAASHSVTQKELAKLRQENKDLNKRLNNLR